MDGTMQDTDVSRPPTPESPMTSSLYVATSTIDDLTAALANFSRVPSPEPPTTIACCCAREECENFKAWSELKSRLQSRLILSAEVGQALLQRHEAYVRRSERRNQQVGTQSDATFEDSAAMSATQMSAEDLHRDYYELAREKAVLEKRLNQALVNNEVTEVSSKTILQELQEARDTISRLTAHHAKSMGWETRLAACLKERDDMQQERDSETNRARLAESRFAALKDRTSKLQAEVRRLQASLEEKRHTRLESSQSIIQDARTRIETFRNTQVGLTAKVEESELTSVVESLVNDNESLKKDNAELQKLLAESREDVHALQEEVEEQRAAQPQRPPSRSGGEFWMPRKLNKSNLISGYTPQLRHHHTNSVPSFKDLNILTPPSKNRWSPNVDFKPRQRQSRLSPGVAPPLSPELTRSPLSPTESLALPDLRWTRGRLSPNPSMVSYDLEEEGDDTESTSEVEHSRHPRPLLLLKRSRGTQTESLQTPIPSHAPSISPQDPRSESSSFSESPLSQVGAILDRVYVLCNRLCQADALTLTNRLKRQHLRGADVRHLSRSTVNGILNEAAGLRTQFRFLLEDDKVVTTCTRKDLRLLFKFVKDIFTEMGQMRITLNDIVLDPTCAPRISESVLHPGKAEADSAKEKEGDAFAFVNPAGWIAPISKLFAPAGRSEGVSEASGAVQRSHSGRTSLGRPGRFVPKLGPALAASATTVNVEFSGSGVGRAVTSVNDAAVPVPPETSTMPGSQSNSSIMGIFAGAPLNSNGIEPESPWVILPPTSLNRSRSTHLKHGVDSPMATAGRTAGRRHTSRLSRNVDALIELEQDNEDQDVVPPLLERTLRRRGLSDSSIHSTFTTQATDETRLPSNPPSPLRNTHTVSPVLPSRAPRWSDRTSVFQTLSDTIRTLRSNAVDVMAPLAYSNEQPSRSSQEENPGQAQTVTTPSTIPISIEPSSSQASQYSSVAPSLSEAEHSREREGTPKKKKKTSSQPVRTPRSGRTLPSWDGMVDPLVAADPYMASSFRDESLLQRLNRSRPNGLSESHSRDFL